MLRLQSPGNGGSFRESPPLPASLSPAPASQKSFQREEQAEEG